jgi:hypothetical protein
LIGSTAGFQILCEATCCPARLIALGALGLVGQYVTAIWFNLFLRLIIESENFREP